MSVTWRAGGVTILDGELRFLLPEDVSNRAGIWIPTVWKLGSELLYDVLVATSCALLSQVRIINKLSLIVRELWTTHLFKLPASLKV